MDTTRFLTIIFFFTLTLHSPTSTAEEEDCDKFLCDDDWNHITAGKPYRFGPPHPEQGGDIILEGRIDEDKPCPRYAIMLPDSAGDDYFIIKPIVAEENGLVPLETPFAIISAGKPACDNETGVLRITKKNKQVKFWHVTVNGEFNTSSSCFQFVNFPRPTDVNHTPTYMLQNCPAKCGAGAKKPKCYQVGNRTYDGDVYLAGNGYPFEFALKGNGNLDSI